MIVADLSPRSRGTNPICGSATKQKQLTIGLQLLFQKFVVGAEPYLEILFGAVSDNIYRVIAKYHCDLLSFLCKNGSTMYCRFE